VVLLAVALPVLAVTGWAGWRALQVRSDLTTAQTMATQIEAELKGGDISRAEAALPALRIRLDRARGRTGGPAWTAAEHLPLLGGNFQAVRQVALAAQLIGDQALPEATAALDLVRRTKPIQSGRVDLKALAQLEIHVARAARAGDRARALLAPRSRLLLWPVGGKVNEARTKVGALDDALRSADKALSLAPGMLGQSGPRHYLVVVQNNAEARGSGGLVGGARADVVALEPRTARRLGVWVAGERVA